MAGLNAPGRNASKAMSAKLVVFLLTDKDAPVPIPVKLPFVRR